VVEPPVLQSPTRKRRTSSLSTSRSVHGSRGLSRTPTSIPRQRTFSPRTSNIAKLDRGRAVVLTSGAPATLVRTMPWYTGPHKEAVEASIKKYSPRPDEEAVRVAAGAAANPSVTG
jgi:hypothetical protein